MASRILANLIVAGGAMLFRAATTAYKQAIINGSKAGMNAETVRQAGRKGKELSLQEAQMILGVESGATWEEIMKKYEHLYEANEKNGSFYLLSKVYRAHERLKDEYQPGEAEQDTAATKGAGEKDG